MKNNKEPNRTPLKNPLIMFLLASICATLLLNTIISFVSSPSKTEISYSEFLTMLSEDKVDEVIIQAERYTIYEKPENNERLNETKQSIDRLSALIGADLDSIAQQAARDARKIYYTGYIRD